MPQLNFKEERLKGNELFKKQHFDMALSVYQKIVKEVEDILGKEDFSEKEELKSELGLVYFNMSVTSYRLNFVDQALFFINKAIKCEDCDKFKAKKAFYKLKTGEYKEAKMIFASLENKNCISDLPGMFEKAKCASIEKEYSFLEFGNKSFPFEEENGEIKFDIHFLEKVTKEFKEKRILPLKMVYGILKELYSLYYNQENVIFLDTNEEVIIFGDTHGQYFDTLSIINKIKMESCGPIIFNGDFVDRGQNSFENFIFISLLKIIFPKKVFLNRGNHEFYELNVTMGFYLELCYKYKENILKIFPSFLNAFSVLPVATVVNRNTFVVHGGIPAEEIGMDQIMKVDRKITNATTNPILNGLLWSDPAEIEGCAPSKRGIGVMFGENILKKFFEKNKLSLLIRSHEFCEEGFRFNHNNKTITIFSAPNYCNSISKGAYVVLKSGFDGQLCNLEIRDFDVYKDEEVFRYEGINKD